MAEEFEVSKFDRPIPGQSLTGEPKNNPWENPAEMSDIEDITAYYVKRLANDEVMDDIAALCQANIPIKPIVQSFITSGNMRGLHSVDSGMLVAPILHQFIKQVMVAMEVPTKDDNIDYEKRANEKEVDRFKLLAGEMLSGNVDMNDPGKELLSELVEEQPQEEETPEEAKPMGLMAKG